MRRYLGASETFIYTLLRFQRGFDPLVLAETVHNLDQFPFARVSALVPGVGIPQRLARRSRAIAAGYRTSYRHRLVKALQRNDCVILHAHFGWTGAAAVEAANRVGIPLVTTFYGRDITDPTAPPYDDLFASGALFFCEGDHMAAHLARVGCPREKIRVVKIGLDLEQFPFQPRPRKNPLILLQTSRFVEKKGVDLSIRAFADVRRRLPRAELWLVGDGPLRAELESLAVDLDVSDAVRFMGALSHARYRELLVDVDLCLQPSRTTSDGDTEGGAPTVLLEMQASGIPVVSTRHADIPSVVPFDDALAAEEDVAGIAAAIVRLAEEADTAWLRRAEVGRRYVENEHDARKISQLVERHYDEALQQPAFRSARLDSVEAR